MLTTEQRISRYLAQNGRDFITHRQRRRIKHKRGHHLVDAVVARAERPAALAKARESRKSRMAGLLSR